jgi:hypothetical protein
MEIVAEEWRPVVGFEGYYEVSDLGRVRSISRFVTAGYGLKYCDGRVLKPSNSRGYLKLMLTAGPKRRSVTVHKVVADAFIGPLPEGFHVNHKDANKQNNSASNLEHVTPDGNIQHAVSLGLMSRGESHGLAKLTDQIVLQVRRLTKQGVTARELSERFGVHIETIHRVVQRKSWTHI